MLGSRSALGAVHGGVRGVRGNPRAEAALEESPLLGETVQVRAGIPPPPVAPQVVRARGVEGDEEEIHREILS